MPAWLAIRYPAMYDRIFREALLKAKIWGRLHSKSPLEVEAREKELLVLLIVYHFGPRFARRTNPGLGSKLLVWAVLFGESCTRQTQAKQNIWN